MTLGVMHVGESWIQREGEMEQMTLGQRIQMCRKRCGLSQEQLGDQMGVSRQAVSKWEQDTARPDIEKLVALAQLFELSTDELLKGIADEAEDDGTAWPIDPDAPFRGWRGRKLPYTGFQKGCRVVGCLLLGGMLIYLLTVYQSLPQTIPTHWNAAGAADAWGSRSSIWWLFLVGAVMYAGMEVLCRFPSVWNMPGNLTEGNWRSIYATMRNTLEVTNCIMAAMFCYLALPAIYPQLPIGLPLLLFLGVYMLVFVLGMIRVYRLGKPKANK